MSSPSGDSRQRRQNDHWPDRSKGAQHALADDLLVDRAECRADFLLTTLELRGDLLQDALLQLVDPELALLLVGDRHGADQVGLAGRLDGLEDVVLVVEEDRELLDRL